MTSFAIFLMPWNSDQPYFKISGPALATSKLIFWCSLGCTTGRPILGSALRFWHLNYSGDGNAVGAD